MVTQDIVDLVVTDPGGIVVANAATRIRVRPAPAIERDRPTFDPVPGETHLRSSEARGQALLPADSPWVAFQSLAGPGGTQDSSLGDGRGPGGVLWRRGRGPS